MTKEPANELNIRLPNSFQYVVTCVQSSDLMPPSQWPSCLIQPTMRDVANAIELWTLRGRPADQVPFNVQPNKPANERDGDIAISKVLCRRNFQHSVNCEALINGVPLRDTTKTKETISSCSYLVTQATHSTS